MIYALIVNVVHMLYIYGVDLCGLHVVHFIKGFQLHDQMSDLIFNLKKLVDTNLETYKLRQTLTISFVTTSTRAVGH